MHPKRIEINDRLRVLIPAGIALGIVVILGLWGGYIYFESREDADLTTTWWQQPLVWVTMACVATFVAPPILYVKIKSYVWLMRHGDEVPGEVVSVGSFTKAGMTPVTYRYTVQGVDYTMKRDTPNLYANTYRPG